jgi:hypothetical protein
MHIDSSTPQQTQVFIMLSPSQAIDMAQHYFLGQSIFRLQFACDSIGT